MSNFKDYLKRSLLRLKSVIEDMGCRPILFVGSGLSIRYMQSPSWRKLLEMLIESNPMIDKPFGYYYQRADENLPSIASLLEDDYHNYAWSNHKDETFPKNLFESSNPKSIFLKYKIAYIFKNYLENFKNSFENNPFQEEIQLLSEIEPHAIITTNYDGLMEHIFPYFTPIIGQKVIRKPSYSDIGEILKIHGCVTDPSSIVISKSDYDVFLAKKKYLTAKLLTYFIEHPLVILGYSLSDENIKHILSDISEMVPSDKDEVVENMWFIEWKPEIDINEYNRYPDEKLIDLGQGKTIRINYMMVCDYIELYETLTQPVAVKQIDVKLLRTLMSNVYDIVKNKSSRSSLEVNIATLNNLSDEGKLLNVLGFGAISNPEIIPTLYPFSLTDVAKQLGYEHWYHANELIKKIEDSTGFNIKNSNNDYHVDVGLNCSANHHYSAKAVELLKNVKDGSSYYVINDDGKKLVQGDH